MLLFDRVCRVPMIVAAPGRKPAASESLVESIDLFPTLAALAGLTPPKELEGKRLAPVLSDPAVSVHDAVFTQVQRGRRGEGRTVRTNRWRYTKWTGEQGGGEELYDEQTDPEEIINLAKDPKHADTVASMKKLLSVADAEQVR
jgi:arylsulfatase A-like enzyme